jgi:hypothetical protein
MHAIGTVKLHKNAALNSNVYMHSTGKLCNVNAECWSIDVKLLIYLDTVF